MRKFTLFCAGVLLSTMILTGCTSQADKDAAEIVTNQIVTIKDVSLKSADDIIAINEAYERLSDKQKKLVENYDVLLSAVDEIEDLKKDETEFLELFKKAYETYQKQGLGADLDYARLEDIYQANPDNEMMKNLYYFCSACGYYRLADIMDDDDDIELGKQEAAKIDPDYDGEYSKEVTDFAKEILGDEYATRAASATKEQETYDNLTMQDKMDILNYIYDHEDENEDVVWKNLADRYGISEEDISKINIDMDVIKAVGEQKKNSNSANTSKTSISEYDATLTYGSGDVLICISEDAMSRYFTAISNKNNGTITKMTTDGEVAWTPEGTKCDIVKRGIAKYQVKLLDGVYAGNTVWVVIEAVNEK